MTDLQVKFWQAYEVSRANREAEKELRRAHEESERQGRVDLAERERHNRASEEINQLMAYASQVQASAAKRQAAVAERRAELERQRVAMEETITSARTAQMRAETLLAESRAATEKYNQQYAKYRSETEVANRDLTWQQVASERERTAQIRAETQESEAKVASIQASTSGQRASNWEAWLSLPANIVQNYAGAFGKVNRLIKSN